MTLVHNPIESEMNQNIARYHARFPRYILQPDDNSLIRVAGPHQIPWEEATEIQNISLSGLAFTAPSDLCPLIGEIVRIQFEVPGSVQTACLGLVTRLEKIGQSTVLAAVEFRKLELPQRIVIAQSLARKLKEQIQQQETRNQQATLLVLRQKWKLLFVAGLALSLWGAAFYVLSTIFSRS